MPDTRIGEIKKISELREIKLEFDINSCNSYWEISLDDAEGWAEMGDKVGEVETIGASVGVLRLSEKDMR